MKTNCHSYIGYFANQETTRPDNYPIQQLQTLKIIDLEQEATGATGDYNVRFIETLNPDGTITATFRWVNIPDEILSVSVSYNDGTDHDTIAPDIKGPFSILIPFGDYTYSFVVTGLSTSTRYALETSPAVQTEIELSEVPAELEVVDEDEDKFKVLRSKQLTITLHTSDTVNISTFALGGDNRWYVEWYSEDPDASDGTPQIQFIGWISMEDLSQTFMPDPNVLTLIATDGMGFTSQEPLVDAYGDTMKAQSQIIDYINNGFRGTGLLLPLVFVANIKNESTLPPSTDIGGEEHFVKYNWLDAKTFEDKIGTSIDGYSAIEAILFGHTVFQHQGAWWCLRIGEMETGSYRYFKYDAYGTFMSTGTQDFAKSVGDTLTMAFMNDDAAMGIIRASKAIKLTYKYENYAETVCNIDFERGEAITPPDFTTIDSEGTYKPECWEFLKRGSGTVDDVPELSASGYVVKQFHYGDEKNRFVQITNSGGFAHYLKSEGVYLDRDDKFKCTVNWKQDVNESGSGPYRRAVIMARLFADSGEVYDWQFEEETAQNYWEHKTDGLEVWNSTVNVTGLLSEDERNFKSVGGECAPLPESGYVYFHLYNSLATRVFQFTSFNLEIIELVNGSYEQYTAQQDEVKDETIKNKARTDKEIKISSSPKQTFKGALLYKSGEHDVFTGSVEFNSYHLFRMSGYQIPLFHKGMKIFIDGSTGNDKGYTITDVDYNLVPNLTTITVLELVAVGLTETVRIYTNAYTLSDRFYDGNLYPLGGPADADIMPYQRILAFDVWNQHNREMSKFDGTIDGTESSTAFPDLLHRYELTDADNRTSNKIFQLLHYRMDVHLCEWEAYFLEVFDTTIEKLYEGHEFKYITK